MLPVETLLDQCSFRRQRRSGPGGQHRNKVETAVVIRHNPTNVESSASERRSQAANRKVAISRLRVRLAIQVRTSVDMSKAPTRLWRSRCHEGRIRISRTHDDYPAVLAEALNTLNHLNNDVVVAAEALHCTASQLTKLIGTEPKALGRVNQQRQEQGLRPLK